MAVKFNPFSGQLQIDEKGSGGASYIDGEVATYNDLPLDGTAPLNSAWLVREASGIWPVSRKQAGIYIRTATAGSSRDADYTYAGTMPDVFSDAVFTLYDEASTTRTGQFNLGSITAGQNRALTWPDGNGTIARTEDFAAPPAIGSTTRNTGAFTTLNATNGTLTASAPVLDLSQTWNNAAVTFTGLRFNVTNTASAATSLLADFQVGGTSRVFIREDGAIRWNVAGPIIRPFSTTVLEFGSGGVSNSVLMSDGWAMNSTTYFGFSDSGNAGSTRDVRLFRDAAAVLALRNLANPQTFRIYNTTDAGLTNFERGFIRWSSNVLQVGTEKGGTGSARNLELLTDNVWRGRFQSEGLLLNSNGPRVYFGSPLISGDGESGFSLDLQPFGSGNVIIRSGLLKMNGTTSSFPALKRSSTTLQVRLADDSAFAPLECGNITVNGTTNGTVGSAVGLLLSAASTNNITFQTNSTLRWTIGGSSGALVSENGIPIRFGGSTSSFPRLVNSGAVLQCSLADGSGSAVFEAQLRAQGTAPATSGATGTAGDIRYDADYIYVCTAANTWKRAAIATW